MHAKIEGIAQAIGLIDEALTILDARAPDARGTLDLSLAKDRLEGEKREIERRCRF